MTLKKNKKAKLDSVVSSQVGTQREALANVLSSINKLDVQRQTSAMFDSLSDHFLNGWLYQSRIKNYDREAMSFIYFLALKLRREASTESYEEAFRRENEWISRVDLDDIFEPEGISYRDKLLGLLDECASFSEEVIDSRSIKKLRNQFALLSHAFPTPHKRFLQSVLYPGINKKSSDKVDLSDAYFSLRQEIASNRSIDLSLIHI